MKIRKLLFPLLILVSAVWQACHQDNLELNGPSARIVFTGQITDENDQPLAGATVSAGSASTTTNVDGVFRLEAVNLPARNAILSVSLAGYFDFSRAYIVENNAFLPVSIQLLKKQMIHSFLATQSTVAQAGPAQIKFPAGSVARSDGNAYSGVVQVYARYLDPVDPDLNRHMPGDLRGIGAGGEEQTLATFGMIGVELTTPGGDPLQIASGREAEIVMPIPSEKSAVAPAEIPLWHYDLEQARWIEDGSAEKIGDQYVGKVKHFSFWNCDAKFPLVYLKGKIFLENHEQPVNGAVVRLTILSNGWEGYADTDSEGRFGGGIPKDEVLKLDVVLPGYCGYQVLYTQNIGPFSTDVSLPDIVIKNLNASTLVVSGHLIDCKGKPVTNGFAIAHIAGYDQHIYAEADGNFNAVIVQCDDADVQITGYDITNINQSETMTFSKPSASIEVGDLAVCGGVNEFIEIIFDGAKTTFIDSLDAVILEGTWTHIRASQQNAAVAFSIDNNFQTGTFPLQTFSLSPSGVILNNLNMNAVITEFGPPGQRIAGTLSGTAQSPDGQTHTISGSFRLMR